MDTETKTATAEILSIQSELDMGAKGMAKAMNITVNTFNKKRSEKEPGHSFNEKNLNDLKNYLKRYMATIVKYTNEEAAALFAGKKIINNYSDGTVWVCDDFEVISSHQPEYKTAGPDWQDLECKFPGTNGFGKKKVKIYGLEKTEYVRDNFSNTFHEAFKSSPVSLNTKEVEKISPTTRQG